MSTLRERLGITLQVNTDIPFVEDWTDVHLNTNDASTIRYSVWREEERRAIEEYNRREYLSEREFNNFNREFLNGGVDVSEVDVLSNVDNNNPINTSGCVCLPIQYNSYVDTSFSEDPIVYDSSGNIDIISFNCDRGECETGDQKK